MATELKEGVIIKRQLRVYGVEAPVNVEISSSGIRMAIKGTRTWVEATWPRLVEAMFTPGDVPSFLAHKPLELLKHFATKSTKKKK